MLAAITLLSALTANAQSPDMVADLAARINRERTARGLVPYALNSDLTIAAQAHASDIARTGNLSHVGSDGSTVFQRVARTGYGSYSWGRRLGENWAWYHSTSDAVQKWMESPPHRDNILHALYREFGIGIAPNPIGGYVFVIVFGAQPNILPIFINDASGWSPTPGVTIVLSDEQVAPFGDTPTTIGHPTEIQISNDPGFSGAKWEPYSMRQSWTLPSGIGIRTVYVKFRDARGRTVASSDSIALGGVAADLVGAFATVKPAASPTQTRRPTATRTRTPRPTSSPSPTPSQTVGPTKTQVVTLLPTAPAETATSDAQNSEQAIPPATPIPVEPMELAALVTDLVPEQPTDDEARYTDGAPFKEAIGSFSGLVTAASSDTGKVALAAFAVAGVIGIMTVIWYWSGRKRTMRR